MATTEKMLICQCDWTPWMNGGSGSYKSSRGDNNTYARLRQDGHVICQLPERIECRSVDNPSVPWRFARQDGVECDVTEGILCESRADPLFICQDYELRAECCECYQPTTAAPTTQPLNLTAAPLDPALMTSSTSDVTPPTATIRLDENLIPVLIISGVLLLFVLFIFCCKRRVQKHHRHRRGHRHQPLIHRYSSRSDQTLFKFNNFDLNEEIAIPSPSTVDFQQRSTPTHHHHLHGSSLAPSTASSYRGTGRHSRRARNFSVEDDDALGETISAASSSRLFAQRLTQIRDGAPFRDPPMPARFYLTSGGGNGSIDGDTVVTSVTCSETQSNADPFDHPNRSALMLGRRHTYRHPSMSPGRRPLPPRVPEPPATPTTSGTPASTPASTPGTDTTSSPGSASGAEC